MDASASALKISWAKAIGASGDEVWYSTSEKGIYKKIKSTTGISYVHTKLTAGKTYYYKVRSYKTQSDGNKKYSGYATIVPRALMAVPGSVKLANSSATSLKVSWSKVSGATGYEIYRETSQSGSYTKAATVSILTFTDKSLKSGKTYYYKIKSTQKTTDKTYKSSYSGIGKATTKVDYYIGNKNSGILHLIKNVVLQVN